jgi:chromosome segregation ATPase
MRGKVRKEGITENLEMKEAILLPDAFYERLAEAKERKYRLSKAERRREELIKRKNEQERRLVHLEVELESEQADVDKLTHMSLTNLFHTILRNKEEQLELERQQALAAALKLKEAKEALASIESELIQIGDDLMNFRDAEREYERVMAEKEAALRHSAAYSSELAEMEAQIADQAIRVKELDEALTAGRRVLSSLTDASASLEKAENWGKWDTWGGGGMISTHLKHGHVDDARQYIHQANRQLQTFRDELSDLKRSIEIEIDIGEMLKLADYWFDGLITDWVVQGRIQRAQDQTLEAIHRVRTIVHQLQAEHAAAESALSGTKSKRIAWIEGTHLE